MRKRKKNLNSDGLLIYFAKFFPTAAAAVRIKSRMLLIICSVEVFVNRLLLSSKKTIPLDSAENSVGLQRNSKYDNDDEHRTRY